MSSHRIADNPRERLIDREMSWLDFDERVLELAEDPAVPLLERCRFLSIFSSNLDDFYMIRVATLKRKIESGMTKANPAGFTPKELLVELSKKTQTLIQRQSDCFHKDILPRLAKVGIEVITWADLNAQEIEFVNKIFHTRIFPVLTPLAVDPSHPFPYISGLSLNLAVVVAKPDSDEEMFARVKIPSNLPRFLEINLTGKKRFIPLEEVVIANLSELFHGMTIKSSYTFRLTRNADLELEEDESEDLLATMEQELLRRKFGPPVRLEVNPDIDLELLGTLMEELGVTEEDISRYAEPLDLTGLGQIADIALPALKYPPFSNVLPLELKDVESDDIEGFFSVIRRREVLLHHPYESFNGTVVRFLQNAARDPNVLAIKQTLYRTSGDSPIVEALIEAAEAGKQVLAVIEIRARFDELANVRWARKLEDAGVHVVYGLVGFKTHAKLSLVVREEAGIIRRYLHIGTGNYNPKTARLYEDFGLLSSDPILGEDVNKLFNQLSGFAPQTSFARLLVAPRTMRSGLLERINREIDNHKAGKPAFIRLKLNAVLDEEFIEALYKASNAGVRVELIIRGICAIRVGVPGLSENITARSILGRFLEHSRIFQFHNDGEDELWLGSADLMHRNLDRRVESLVKVTQGDHKRLLLRALDAYMADDVVHWSMDEAGEWQLVKTNDAGEPLKEFHSVVLEYYRQRG